MDKLFSRHKFVDEDVVQDEVKEERSQILKQKNKEREDTLREFTKK